MSKATTAERAKNRKPGTFSRLIKTLFSFYPVLLPLVTIGVIVCAVINSIGATFLQRALEIISASWQSGDWEAARPQILSLATTLGCIYAVGVLSSLFWNRAMATVTQGSLEKLREKMFNRMQDLPIRYFDTHQRGDIMSHYTNDIDTLRQMISQSLPNLLMTIIVICTVFFIMLYYSVWMCLVIIAGVTFMTFMTKLLGSNSARFFIAQQTELGVVEGHIEEVMNGQKVVKAFCHESAAEADFDERNEKLFEVSQKANMTSVCHIEHVADHVVEHHRICIVQIPLVWVKCSHDHLIAVIYPCEVTRRRSWEYLRHSLLIYVRNEPIIIEEISGSCNRISISRCPCPLMILTCMVHYEIQTAAYTLSVTLCSEVLQILHGSKLRLYLSEIRNSISAVISALRAFQQRHKMKIIHTT